MLKPLFEAVMARRSRALMDQLGDWLPEQGRVLDLGSGTGHLSAALEAERGLDVVTADVSDLHVVGRPPVIIADGKLPFDDSRFSATLLVFMLAYPADPVTILREASRVTRGPVVLVQTLNTGRLGRAWHRLRELAWTFAAFHLAKAMGYVPRGARFTMHTRRFYAEQELERDVRCAGLRVSARRERAVLPSRALFVAAWRLEK